MKYMFTPGGHIFVASVACNPGVITVFGRLGRLCGSGRAAARQPRLQNCHLELPFKLSFNFQAEFCPASAQIFLLFWR